MCLQDLLSAFSHTAFGRCLAHPCHHHLGEEVQSLKTLPRLSLEKKIHTYLYHSKRSYLHPSHLLFVHQNLWKQKKRRHNSVIHSLNILAADLNYWNKVFKCMTASTACGKKSYLLLPPASTGHRCRTPGPNHLSPTSVQSPLHTTSLYSVPGLLHHRAKLHAAPTPHSSHHPKTHKITQT